MPALVLSDLYHIRVGGKSLLLNVPADSEAHWESAGLAGEAREANWYSTIRTAHTCIQPTRCRQEDWESDHPRLQHEVQASLGYMRPCHPIQSSLRTEGRLKPWL